MNYKDIKTLNDNIETVFNNIEASKTKWTIWAFKETLYNIDGKTRNTFDFNPWRYTLKGLYNEYKNGKYTLEEYKSRLLYKVYFDMLYYKFYNKYNISIYNTTTI